MYGCRWIDGRYCAVATPSLGKLAATRVAVDALGEQDDVDEPRSDVVVVVGERRLDASTPASSSS